MSIAGVLRPAAADDDDRVAEDHTRREKPDVAQPFDRRLAMPAHHFVEFVDRLRHMQRDRHA